MNFNDWFSALQTRTASNSGAGLAAFKELLARLKNPQQNYKIIHVAGTNGKGTVCMLLAHTLTGAGEKTGLFISPHLTSPTERLQIDSIEIAPKDFINAVESVLACEQEPLNLFEILTAAAFVYFAEQKVTYAVLETGLGGRKDPTNSCLPILSIITSVGLDHTHLLGDSLEKIAAEKAGIIKPGVPVLCGDLSSGVTRVVEEIARERKAPLEILHAENSLGNAQAQNRELACRAAKFLKVPDEVIAHAVETVKVPGRFEIFSCGKKTIILDGAHNPQAIENLLAFWQTTPFAQKPATALCAFMQDKDYPKMLSMLSACFKTGTVTAVSSPRAAGKNLITPLLPPGWEFISDISAAFIHAQAQAEVVLVTGSFYLVGEIRKRLINNTLCQNSVRNSVLKKH